MTIHQTPLEAVDPPRRSRRARKSPLAIIVGLIGELMITAGLFVGLFVVWQIWWTDIEARERNAAVLEMFDTDAETVDPLDVIEDHEKMFDDAPLLASAGPGETIAVLRVPDWGTDYRTPIAEYIDPMISSLDVGDIVRYENTADPGHLGNFALAGHRQSHGAAFYNVDSLSAGDSIIVESQDHWYVYSMTEYKIVLPTDVDVIMPNPHDAGAEPTERLLTLTTCHPIFSTRERYIVHATFDYWAPKTAGIPAELMED